MLASLLALASAPCYGSADFVAGLKSRTIPALTVTVVSQAAGAAFTAGIVVVRWEKVPAPRFVALGVLTGIAALVGIWSLYRALAIGPMGIVAPIAAMSVIAPVAVGFTQGERPGRASIFGIVACIVGIMLVSRARDTHGGRVSRPALMLSLVAAVSLGGVSVGFDAASAADPYWAVAVCRATVVVLLLFAFAPAQRSLDLPPGRDIRTLAGMGVLNESGNLLFSVASTLGPLMLVSVLSTVYPVVTTILARVVLGERLSRWQLTGTGAVLVGIACITLA